MALHKHPIGRALIASLLLTVGVAAAIISVSLVAEPAAAQFGLKETLGGIKEKPATYSDDNTALPRLIGRIISTALSLVGTLFLVLMIYGGFLWMTARGDQKNVQKARDLISSAIIGLIIVASAYAITTFLISRLGSETEQTAGDGEEVDECAAAPELSCTTGSDCTATDLRACYTGTCLCSGAGDPQTGGLGSPCTVGTCTKSR